MTKEEIERSLEAIDHHAGAIKRLARALQRNAGKDVHIMMIAELISGGANIVGSAITAYNVVTDWRKE